MRITITRPTKDDTIRYLIEIDSTELRKHIESNFEAEARKVYQKTKSMSDLLFWLSEWANTEE